MAALWAASAYVGSFMVASDRIYEIVQRRPFWKSLPLRVGLALALLVLLSATAAVVALVGPFGRWLGDATGIGAGPLHLWAWIKWPLLIALGLLLFTLLYKFTPSRRQPALWWLLPAPRRAWRSGSRRPPGSASTSTTSPRTTACTARSAPRSPSSCGPGS